MGSAAPTTPQVLQPASTMKLLVTILFAAAATAEANPYLVGYHSLDYAGHVYPLPYAAAGFLLVSPSASLTTLRAAPAAIPAISEAYASAGRYVANSAGVIHVAKREAKAAGYPPTSFCVPGAPVCCILYDICYES